MFRLYATVFRGTFRGTHEQEHHLHESPSAMTIPLIVLAILSVAGGWIGIPEFMASGANKLNEFLAPVFASSNQFLESRGRLHEIDHNTEWMLTGLSSLLIILVVVFAWNKFSRKPELAEAKGLGRVLENKWYVDELYDSIIVKPLNWLGGVLNSVVEKDVIDGLVNGVGRAVNYGSRQLRLLQSGQVANYVLLMVLSMLVVFVLQFFLRK
jgi:NADH-quinone oxidoreductase subunit L